MADYTQDIIDAQADIKEAGAQVIWRKIVRVDDPDKPWNATEAPPQDFPVSMLFLTNGLSNPLVSLMRNTDITDGAPDAIMAGGLTFTPELTDMIINDTEEFVVDSIGLLAPDGTPILYYLRFK